MARIVRRFQEMTDPQEKLKEVQRRINALKSSQDEAHLARIDELEELEKKLLAEINGVPTGAEQAESLGDGSGQEQPDELKISSSDEETDDPLEEAARYVSSGEDTPRKTYAGDDSKFPLGDA